MTGIKKITLVLNTDDPEQKELYNFVNCLPNGQKRNSSAFLRTLVDREYQKKKEQYLQEKKTQEASIVKVVQSTKKNIKYLAKDVNQNTNQSSDGSTN
jgi:selenophosphate synthase